MVNGDNDHYFKACCMKAFVPVEARVASADGARRYLDALAAGGKVTHFFACAVGQRASFDATSCDPIWLAIDEAKARGVAPDEWPLNAKRMHDAGFDCYRVWCEYGRKKGVSVWISQRMNDVHHADRAWNIRTNRFWYDHPELHREPGHDRTKGGGWTRHALDYSKPEVRDFAFGIFRELVDRYDADGFELDFMRFWEHLTPGREREQAPILTAFIRRCRDYANPVVTVLPCVCDNASCSGAPAPLDGAALAGWADNAYAAGAEGVYLFNAAYLPDAVQRAVYARGCAPEVVRAGARRYLPAGRESCALRAESGGVEVRLARAVRRRRPAGRHERRRLRP